MMYRNFAIAILLAAPIIVMGVQSFAPHPHPSATDTPAPIADAAPPPVSVAPPVVTAPSAPQVVNSADFGQPVSGAGQPMLSPGTGLPEGSVQPMVTPDLVYAPGQAPAGTPNGER